MKHLRFLALALSLCTLSACQTLNSFVEEVNALEMPSMPSLASFENETKADDLIYHGNCPSIHTVEELSSMSEFTNLDDMDDRNLISRVDITKVTSNCDNSASSVTVDLKMAFDGMLGPRAGRVGNDKTHFSYPFFVAITDAGGRILAKEIFAANMVYPAGESRHTYHENMRQIIPIETRDRAKDFKILIGFQLGPDQLAYNRARLAEIKAQEALDAKLLKEAAKVEAKTKPAAKQINTNAPIPLGGQ